MSTFSQSYPFHHPNFADVRKIQKSQGRPDVDHAKMPTRLARVKHELGKYNYKNNINIMATKIKTISKRQKELLEKAVNSYSNVLGKIMTSCLKEGQTTAAGQLNEDIKLLRALVDDNQQTEE